MPLCPEGTVSGAGQKQRKTYCPTLSLARGAAFASEDQSRILAGAAAAGWSRYLDVSYGSDLGVSKHFPDLAQLAKRSDCVWVAY